MAWGRINITGGAVSGLPEFTYTGVSQLFDDGTGNWRIKFLTSGTLTPLSNLTVDINPSINLDSCGTTIWRENQSYAGGINVYAKATPTSAFTFLTVRAWKE